MSNTFFSAAINGNVNEVIKILSHNQELLDKQNKDEYTALH